MQWQKSKESEIGASMHTDEEVLKKEMKDE
jgi:hypothetical protein